MIRFVSLLFDQSITRYETIIIPIFPIKLPCIRKSKIIGAARSRQV